jgi:hypothetical protein
MQKTRIDWNVKDLYTWNPVLGCQEWIDSIKHDNIFWKPSIKKG